MNHISVELDGKWRASTFLGCCARWMMLHLLMLMLVIAAGACISEGSSAAATDSMAIVRVTSAKQDFFQVRIFV